MKNWKLTLTILAISSVLMSSSYTMLIPFLPMYLIQELGVEQANVNWWSSIIFSISFLISGLMAPIWGALADKKSRKLMAIRASFCLAISYILGGFVTTPWELFGVRVFQGFAAGLWPALLSIMSGEAPQKRLGFCMGVMQAGLTAGHVLGPLAGGILAELFTMRATFLIAGAGLFLISLAIIFLIHETPRPKVEQKAEDTAEPRPSVLKIPAVQRMLFAACIVQMTILMTQPVLPLYIAELQGSMNQIVLISGIVFSIIGISGVIASPLWGILGQSWGFRPALYLALFLSGIFGVIQAIPQDLTAFTVWRFVGGLTFAGIFPAINAVLTQSTDPADRGKVFGYSYASQQLGSVVGPILGGAMATWISNQMVVAMAGALLFPLVVLLYLRRPKTRGATGTPQNGI
ncbi:MAG: MFS transporter [Duodenibacillus sp.]|nr:MFS transporter [Duodenibacillus sp.]